MRAKAIINVLKTVIKTPRLIRKFFAVLVLTVGAFALLAGSAYFVRKNGEKVRPDVFAADPTPKPQSDASGEGGKEDTSASANDVAEIGPEQVPLGDIGDEAEPAGDDLTYVLVVGVDNSNMLTDVIIVACLNKTTGEMNALSVPRDTRIEMPAERVAKMRELGLHPPAGGVMKVNAVNSYGGKTYGIALLIEQLKDLLGVEMDYYAMVKLDAFRKIVDTVGGVDMNIPKGGLYYSDPYQNLKISVPEGPVHLDGGMAEGVVRFRATYRDGDIGRIKVQQEFIRQFLSQALKADNLLSHPIEMIKILLGYVSTDFSITDVPSLLPFIKSLDGDSVNFYTLPGYGKMINGAAYYILNDDYDEVVGKAFFRGSAEGGL